MHSSVVEALRRISRYLDDHWVLKWFVVPILSMATVLLVLFLTLSTADPTESLQIVLLFLGFSFGVVLLGLSAEYALIKLTGIELFYRRNDHE